jgi:3-isopropylmalate/(R)-2-methylmalate dehydratase small subunit
VSQVVLKLGDDVSTDVIYPGRYMATVLPTETPQFAFADLTDFNAKLKGTQVPQGSFVVAGKNFGCGSSREQAVSTLKGHELVIVAKGFARIFTQNSVNLGLNLVEAPEIEADEGDELEIQGDEVLNVTRAKRYRIVPLPPARQALIEAGGLIAYTRQRLMAKAGVPSTPRR